MSHPTTEQDKDAVYAATGEIAKALNEPQVRLVTRVVWTLGIEQAQAALAADAGHRSPGRHDDHGRPATPHARRGVLPAG